MKKVTRNEVATVSEFLTLRSDAEHFAACRA